MDKLDILIIEGGSRPQRRSQNATKLIETVGSEMEGVKVNLVGPADFDVTDDGNTSDPKYDELVEKADAYFIVIPEYNHGFPGGLKRLLDTNLDRYVHKPVALAGVSSGPWGGTRAIELLVPVVRELGMVVTSVDVNFAQIKNVFDETGTLLEKDYLKRIDNAYKELIWMAKTLKWGRKNLESEA